MSFFMSQDKRVFHWKKAAVQMDLIEKWTEIATQSEFCHKSTEDHFLWPSRSSRVADPQCSCILSERLLNKPVKFRIIRIYLYIAGIGMGYQGIENRPESRRIGDRFFPSN